MTKNWLSSPCCLGDVRSVPCDTIPVASGTERPGKHPVRAEEGSLRCANSDRKVDFLKF